MKKIVLLSAVLVALIGCEQKGAQEAAPQAPAAAPAEAPAAPVTQVPAAPVTQAPAQK